MRTHLRLCPKLAQAKRDFGIFNVHSVSGKNEQNTLTIAICIPCFLLNNINALKNQRGEMTNVGTH